MDKEDMLWIIIALLAIIAFDQAHMYSITAEERDELQIALEQGERCDVFCAEMFSDYDIDN